MSLRPDDRGSRGRSKSPGGRDRSRSRSNVRVAEAPDAPSAVPRTSYVYPPSVSASPMPGSFSAEPTYDVRSPSETNHAYSYPTSSVGPPLPYSAGTTSMPYPQESGGFTMGGYTDLPPHERPGYVPPHQGQYPPPPHGQPPRRDRDDDLAYGDDDDKRDKPSRHSSYTSGYRYTPAAASGEQRPPPSQYQYAQAPGKVSYSSKPSSASPPPIGYSAMPYGQPPPRDVNYSSTAQGQFHEQLPRTYAHNAFDNQAHIVDITPGREKLDRHNSVSKTARFSSSMDHQQSSGLMAPGSQGLGARMNRLSVSGNRPDLQGMGTGMAPPSPLLEAYHGTYQSISPMPLAIRPDDDDDFSDLEPLEPVSSRNGRGHGHNDKLARELAERDRASAVSSSSSKKKSIRIYDGEEDAKAIASALNHHKPDGDALCDIIPRLTHDHMMEVRKEYKKVVKVQGKGVNLSKHINMKLSGSMFGKAVYVTALGRWESEGYWANFWYQSHGSRRELLIESLMGRMNAEIRMIKDEFRDKRYSDSLTKCMEKELKMDKFRTAVLMVLEERRQEEQDSYPMEYIHKDVDSLYRSVRADKGGESAMLEIIIRRSDAHLKEVLRSYEKTFGENFARAALQKSNNLVGEVIAHILNGVINKPARDAALLRHAIQDIHDKNKDDELRYELLISRLVRIHWDRAHLMRVKKEFYERGRVTLEDAINDATKGDFREFMCEICETK